jgi:hypothetical protein
MILRATQFFECLSQIVAFGRREALNVDAWGRRLLAAAADERTVIGDPQARYCDTELHGGELTPGDGTRIGMIDFATWFAMHPQGARRWTRST